MSLLDLLALPLSWEEFYKYKTDLACPRDYAESLRGFIDEGSYLPVCEKISRGEPFPLPKKAVISKLGSGKKRTVYIYPEPENTVLKLLTWLLLRRFDGLFDRNLYSFRPRRSAKDAVRHLTGIKGIRTLYSYKVDIHNYFNSVPVDRFLPMLEDALGEDRRLYDFLSSLLSEPCVLEKGLPVEEQKGIMAGTPLASFYANLYLKGLDHHYQEAGIPYARYSDDIIVFCESRDECEKQAEFIKSCLADMGLELNPDKEQFSSPEDGWVFLGFSYLDGVIDIAPATLKKLKQKMRRKARALRRWADRNGIEGENAAKAFIRVFNRKLLESPKDSQLSWSYWFFSVINTDSSLHEIDLYAQDCLRYLISGKRSKARYNVRYEELKALGYRSLVHEYYKETEEDAE
ncbi:MAG: group II intron reverse transcriptase domain-containing protein [Firmicutes bacterium]|nr:group II intron reverse transcriptase domain-containing protein [Bacillota bacterium]